MGNEKTVRIGIIGCGGIANGKHMPSLRQIPGVQMVAFCDIIEERARKAKQDYGTPDAAVYTDYRCVHIYRGSAGRHHCGEPQAVGGQDH